MKAILVVCISIVLAAPLMAQQGPPGEGWIFMSSSDSITTNYTYESNPYTALSAGTHEFLGDFLISKNVTGDNAPAPWSPHFDPYGDDAWTQPYDATVTFTAAGQVGWAAWDADTHDGDEYWKHVPNNAILHRHTFYDVLKGSAYGKGPYPG